jgi:acetoin utilization deacetylase AcuC-like enzyme
MLCVYYNKSINKNPDHFENHDRILVSIKYLKDKFKDKIEMYNNESILDYLKTYLNIDTKESAAKLMLNQIYSEDYLEKIKLMCDELKGDDIIEGDTYFSNVTYNEIFDNSVILYNVCYQINIGRIKYAYCLIRPPSHHSSLNHYNGFCIVNHTYLTAKYMHDKYNKRVLILDYDVHHGDGTQALVNDHIDDNIYFASIHCYGNGFYPGTGNEDENNEKVLNVPMRRGCKNDDYMISFYKIKKFIEENNIDIIVVSNGLDAHKDDPFKVMNLTNEFYSWVAKYLKLLDKQLIYILEGGYNPKTIGYVSEDIIKVLTTQTEEVEKSEESTNSEETEETEETKETEESGGSEQLTFDEKKRNYIDDMEKIIESNASKAKKYLNEYSNNAIDTTIHYINKNFPEKSIKEFYHEFCELEKINENTLKVMKDKHTQLLDKLMERIDSFSE